MAATDSEKIDRLAEATGGKHHWNDPGMSDFECGYEEFTLGSRVEARCPDNVFRKGTVVETPAENDRALVVECDEKVHDEMTHREGRGLTIMVVHNTRRGILSNIRMVDEPKREIVIPPPTPITLTGNGAKLLELVEAAVAASGGRLRLAFAEEDGSAMLARGAHRFLKLDDKRLGRDIELYARTMAETILSWPQVLPMVLEELVMPLRCILPESYEAAAKLLKELGETVYSGETLEAWRGLF